MKPFDCLFFSGESLESKIIEIAEFAPISHVGLIIDATILPSVPMKPNKLYVWESTSSVKSKEDPLIDGSHFGCQIRELTTVVNNYKGIIWYATCNQIIELNSKEISDKLEEIHSKYQYTSYDFDPIDLVSAVWKPMRYLRSWVDLLIKPNWMFCSELVSIVYQELGLIEKQDPRNFTPSAIASLKFMSNLIELKK